MKIGNKLKALRTLKGYSIDFVSEKTGVSKTTYSRYERDETSPDLNTIEQIATLYNITTIKLLSVDIILFNETREEPPK